MLNFWSLLLSISIVLARCSGWKSESVVGAAIYRGAVIVLNDLNSESSIAVLTIDTGYVTLVHEGGMSHSAHTADAVFGQLLADKATTPAAPKEDQKIALTCATV